MPRKGGSMFEILDHTADVGVSADGATREELFESAATGMFSIIGDTDTVDPAVPREISVAAQDLPHLLAEFLKELLYIFSVEQLMVSKVNVESCSDTHVRAAAYGEPISPKHSLYTEIKAVTHHQLAAGKDDGTWKATVLFDI